MAFLARALRVPSYGYEVDGILTVPSHRQLFREFFGRLNLFADRRNWLAFFSWTTTLSFAVPLVLFLVFHFSLPLLFAGFVYSMIVLGTHGTVWYHRYSTHRAFKFSHPIFRFLVKNSVVKIIPEELYVVSHHVHHSYSEQPGDPYNVNGGWLYCFLADANHQIISRDYSSDDYLRAVAMLSHTGVRTNSYAQYRKWGSLCHPVTTFLHFALNWMFWYAAFWAVGGHALALALLGSCGVWGIGVRTFNFDGHGGGKDKRVDGVDFYRGDHSLNQIWPGVVTGEWHNNHHMYPNGARSGFLPYQIDPAWWCIRGLDYVGGIASYRDFKAEFLRDRAAPVPPAVCRAES